MKYINKEVIVTEMVSGKDKRACLRKGLRIMETFEMSPRSFLKKILLPCLYWAKENQIKEYSLFDDIVASWNTDVFLEAKDSRDAIKKYL